MIPSAPVISAWTHWTDIGCCLLFRDKRFSVDFMNIFEKSRNYRSWSGYLGTKQARKRRRISKSQKCHLDTKSRPARLRRWKERVCVSFSVTIQCVCHWWETAGGEGWTFRVPGGCSSQLSPWTYNLSLLPQILVIRYHPRVCFHLFRSSLTSWLNQRIWKEE